jgi:hypothetical protein
MRLADVTTRQAGLAAHIAYLDLRQITQLGTGQPKKSSGNTEFEISRVRISIWTVEVGACRASDYPQPVANDEQECPVNCESLSQSAGPDHTQTQIEQSGKYSSQRSVKYATAGNFPSDPPANQKSQAKGCDTGKRHDSGYIHKRE